MYWFPKAFGFKLNEPWGKAAFWFWMVGFYLAFMPLYALGLMGMPRRMEHYNDPAWQPWLIAASVGAALILIGIVCLVAQVAVSIRDRRAAADATGDPWDGRTLEWATSSPPPAYNFAVLPQVNDREPLLDMKQRGVVLKRPTAYTDIEIPKNSAVGIVVGGLSFVLGFAMVWHIWWLALACGLGILIALVVRASDDEAEYVLPASEVARLEEARYQALTAGGR
jgi:cytochrome o ubiquinol oxidase subunit 1